MEAITLQAVTKNLEQAQSFVCSDLLSKGCDQKIVSLLLVAVEEIFVNIAHYAYGNSTGEVTISKTFLEDRPGIGISFSDSGVAFNPLAHPDPDVTLPAKDRPIGGLGIYIVKRKMDDIQYTYENGHNILTIIKYFA